MFMLLFAVDVTVYYDGHHGDLNETFFVGTVSESRRNLVQRAYECMMKGIEIGKLSNQGYGTKRHTAVCISKTWCEVSRDWTGDTTPRSTAWLQRRKNILWPRHP